MVHPGTAVAFPSLAGIERLEMAAAAVLVSNGTTSDITPTETASDPAIG